MMGIYKIENLINGKRYIGQSGNIQERWADHKRINERPLEIIKQRYPLYRAFNKYGLDNFSFEIIEECSADELDAKERYWIAYYHTYINDIQCNGYNLTLGGGGNQQITSDEIQTFIDLWEQGMSTGEIAVITEHNTHAIIKYLKLYCPSYSVYEGNRRGQVLNGIAHRKGVNRYDLLGNLIASYSSIKEAESDTQISASTIIRNAKHKTTTCHDSFFFYTSDDVEECLKLHYNLNKLYTPVIQLNMMTNEPIACFVSAKVGAQQFKKETGAKILDCCYGRLKTAYGYKWKFIEYEDIERYNLRELSIQSMDNIKKCYFCEQRSRVSGEVYYGYNCNNDKCCPEYFNLYYCPVCGKRLSLS